MNAASVLLLLTCGDGEKKAEVYGCAADRNRAKIVFEGAVDIVLFCLTLDSFPIALRQAIDVCPIKCFH